MKYIPYPTIFVCLCLFIACNKPNTTKENQKDSSKIVQKATDMLQVTVEEEAFRITFPEAPERNLDSLDRSMEYFVSRNNDTTRFLLYYRDYKPEIIAKTGARKFLEIQEKQVIEGNKFSPLEVIEDKEISMQGHTGLSLKAGSKDKFFLIYRIYLVGNRLYQLGVSDMKGFPDEKETQGFFKSFQLKTVLKSVSKS